MDGTGVSEFVGFFADYVTISHGFVEFKFSPSFYTAL